MQGLRDEIVQIFQQHSPTTWWGDYFDVRFYVASQLRKIHGERILDVCCGSGILDYFVSADNELVGVDINEDYLRIARDLNKDRLYIAKDLFEFSDAAKFTLILAIHAIELFPKQKHLAFVSKLLSFLDANGGLILTTPNGEYGSYTTHENKLSYGYLDKLLSGHELEYKIFGYNPMKTRRYPSDKMLSKFPLIANKVDSKLYEGESARKCKSFYVECRRLP